MRKRVRFRLLLAVMALFLTVSQAPAAYQPVAVLRHPFASEHIGPQGIVVRDGLVRHKRLVATLYRTGMTDCLTVEATTNDSGSCTLLFDRWPNIGSPVEPGSVERLELSLPGTYRATRAGSGFSFEPLRIERISASGKSGETLEVLLPLSVSVHDTTIGTGPFEFDFVVLTDPHIASGKKVDERGWGDFGSEGWNDSDTGLTERPWPIERIEACVAFINSELVGQPGCDARFVAVTGDFTNYSERSEYQRARHVFSALDARLFLVPLPGNHDGWPFVGIIPVPPWGPYGEFDEQDPSEVCIGEFFVDAFRGVYDTLRSVKPVPNWQSDVHLLTPAPSESTCHEWPSYYANFGFSYQGTRFIATDFTTRAHAPRVPFGGWPGLNYDPDTYSGGAYHWTFGLPPICWTLS